MRTPLQDRNNLMLSFDFDKRAYVLGADIKHFLQRQAMLPSIVEALEKFGGKVISYQEAGLPRGMIHMNWKQFGPRLGFAYRALDGRKAFVLRGGYRISYYPETTGTVYNAIEFGVFTRRCTGPRCVLDTRNSGGPGHVTQLALRLTW